METSKASKSCSLPVEYCTRHQTKQRTRRSTQQFQIIKLASTWTSGGSALCLRRFNSSPKWKPTAHKVLQFTAPLESMDWIRCHVTRQGRASWRLFPSFHSAGFPFCHWVDPGSNPFGHSSIVNRRAFRAVLHRPLQARHVCLSSLIQKETPQMVVQDSRSLLIATQHRQNLHEICAWELNGNAHLDSSVVAHFRKRCSMLTRDWRCWFRGILLNMCVQGRGVNRPCWKNSSGMWEGATGNEHPINLGNEEKIQSWT